jgi:uncharacterized protein YihD (DUF1040 family)
MFVGLYAQDMKNIENYRIYKMSEYLELTPEQAQTFFPLLRQYEKQIKDIKTEENELYTELKSKQGKEVSEEELKKAMDKIAGFESQRTDMKQNFMKQSGKMLSPGQVASIPGFEQEFRNDLKQQFIQKQKQQGKNAGWKKLFKGKK